MEKKVYLIGNSHLDPVWLWRWQEGFAEIKATFRSALDRMKEFDDFKFTSACGAYYMWIEKSDKAMFDEIVTRVKEGRWCLVGGFLIQPDCNLPSGESFARHALITQRYFEEKFGVRAHIGYNVDSFGHNGNLPQILRKSGMDSYVFMRPMKHEKTLPSYLFDWESADGSRVRTYRIPEAYNIDMVRLHLFDEVKNLAQTENQNMMAFYGVGNHGGGATVELLDTMHKTLSEDFVYATADEYFKSVENADVPVVRDDLQFHAKGCYSAMSEIKKNNRLCENKLMQTEAYAVLSARLMHTPYPEKELKKAWENVLFNQFHDILGGCSLREAYDDARIVHGEAQSIAERNINYSLQQISWNIDTMDGKELKPYKYWPPVLAWRCEENIGTPVVVFNPLSFEVEAKVRVHDLPKLVTDANGASLPFQKVRASRTNGTDKFDTLFSVRVPAFGYTVCRMYFETPEAVIANTLGVSDTHLENEYLRVDFNAETGEIASVMDKTTGKTVVGDCSCVLMDETDSDTWSHGITEFKKCAAVCTKGSLHKIEEGPVRATVRSVQHFENTELCRDYSLCVGEKRVTVKTKIFFRERHKMLKFNLRTDLEKPRAYCEIPFGFIERPTDGSEQPTHAWTVLKDETHGMGMATTSKYSFDAENNVLSLTVLRGAIFADHFGERDEFCTYMEQGEHEFTYTLFPFEGFAEAKREEQRLNNPPASIVETFHHGSLPTSFMGIEVSESNIIVTALKKKVDSDAYVLRCYEAENRRTTASFRLFDTTFTTEFAPNEIKTFVVDGQTVRGTDFLEE